MKELTAKGYAGILHVTETSRDVYKSLYICQKSSNCTLKIGKFYSMLVKTQQSCVFNVNYLENLLTGINL